MISLSTLCRYESIIASFHHYSIKVFLRFSVTTRYFSGKLRIPSFILVSSFKYFFFLELVLTTKRELHGVKQSLESVQDAEVLSTRALIICNRRIGIFFLNLLDWFLIFLQVHMFIVLILLFRMFLAQICLYLYIANYSWYCIINISVSDPLTSAPLFQA